METEYKVIPHFSRYLISLSGKVKDTKTGKDVSPSKNPAGYYNFYLFSDAGYKFTWGRHRLLCYVFKHPGQDIDNLVVNHINGIKSDDRLENLEWTAHTGNIHHAGLNQLTSKCIPVAVRDIDTGDVQYFSSIIDCAKELNLSKFAVSHRIRQDERRIFPERKQYRISHSTRPWAVPDNIELMLKKNGTCKSIMVKFILTGEILEFSRLIELADYLNVEPSTLSAWLQKDNQPILPGLIQLKYGWDDAPWREVSDPYKELDEFTGRRVIQITSMNGETQIYPSAAIAARAMQLRPTALHYHVSTNGKILFSDGYHYGYYPYSIAINGPTM
jgi:hypothetical protein